MAPPRQTPEEFLSAIRVRFQSCVRSSLGETNCKLHPLPAGLLILKGECLKGEARDQKAPDFVALLPHDDHVIVLVIEFKSRRWHATEVVNQLSAGGALIGELTGSCGGFQEERLRVLPMLVAEGAKSAIEVQALKRRGGISFRGRPHPVRLLRCGDDLAKKLEIILSGKAA